MNKNNNEIDNGVYGVDSLDEEKVIKPSQWGAVGAKIFKAFSVTHQVLPSGCYTVTIDRTDDKPVFCGKYIKNDQIIHFKDDLTNKLLKEIGSFWSKGDVFKKNGFLHRRGYMLYGSQGTGKSSIVLQVMEDIINRGGVVLMCDNPRFFMEGLKNFRQVESQRPLVCVFEDIDAIIKKYGDTELLSMLDGENQIDKVINIATTNYPELLDKRIVSRPRRFDRIYKVIAPNDQVRISFLKSKLPKDQNLKEWYTKTKGLSFASLAELLISVLCLENDLDETVKILKDLENGSPTSTDSDFGGSLGFGKDEMLPEN